jgi:uncharacterized protein (DUF4415 family)
MTPQQFASWLDDMRELGIAEYDYDCGRLLGLSANSIAKIKKKGTDKRTALACAALLNRLQPYPMFLVNVRLDRDIVDAYKTAAGDEWEARINDVLQNGIDRA